MSGVFQNIDPSPPHRPASVYLCLWCGGRTQSLGAEGGRGSIFWKTPDTALYSTYVSNLWNLPSKLSYAIAPTYLDVWPGTTCSLAWLVAGCNTFGGGKTGY